MPPDKPQPVPPLPQSHARNVIGLHGSIDSAVRGEVVECRTGRLGMRQVVEV